MLVHFSSDYVFDGPRRQPYVETDLPCPRSMYGISKLAGEAMVQAIWPKHFLIRTCGLYGYMGSRDKGTNFVEAIVQRAAQGGPVRVVSRPVLHADQHHGSGHAVARLIDTAKYGLYHLTSAGACTWYEFALRDFRRGRSSPGGAAGDIGPIPRQGHAPNYSVLDNRKFRAAGFEDMRPLERGAGGLHARSRPRRGKWQKGNP